tara:strand:+ start:327 stop:581 length:255 start_codon:yes stop_codon:yes gene_type:complete
MIANCRWLRDGCRTSDRHPDNRLAHRETNLLGLFRLGLVFGVRPQKYQGYHNNFHKLPLNEGNKVGGHHIDKTACQQSRLYNQA